MMMDDYSDPEFDDLLEDAAAELAADLPLVTPSPWQGAIPRPARPFGIVDSTEIRHRRAAVPLVEGFIDRGAVAVLSGNFATFKSFTALAAAASVATGERWMGRTTTEGTDARALYMAGEGADGLTTRRDSWEAAAGTFIAPGLLELAEEVPQLADPASVRALAEYLRAGRFDLLVVDTLARAMVGVDENSATSMGQIIHALYRLKDAMSAVGGSVLVLHHTGRSGKEIRGSSALMDGVDIAWNATSVGRPEDRRVKLENTKWKDRPAAAPITLGCMTVGPSAVMHSARQAAPRPPRESPAEPVAAAPPVELPTARLPRTLAVLQGTYGAGGSFTGPEGAELLSRVLEVSERPAQVRLRELVTAGALSVEQLPGTARTTRYTITSDAAMRV